MSCASLLTALTKSTNRSSDADVRSSPGVPAVGDDRVEGLVEGLDQAVVLAGHDRDAAGHGGAAAGVGTDDLRVAADRRVVGGGRVGAEHASFVTDEVVDRFCVLGPAEQCIRKLKELEALGVTQFNDYNMGEDPAEQIRIFGKDIIPAFRQQPATIEEVTT